MMRKALHWLRLVPLLAAALAGPALADSAVKVPGSGLVVSGAWVRAVPPVSSDTVAYLVIRNTGTSADALLAVDSPAAASVTLHRMVMVGDVMRMDTLKKLDIGAGQTVSMDPDGLHIMLDGLKAPLKAGDSVLLTLHFRKGRVVTVKALVKDDPA